MPLTGKKILIIVKNMYNEFEFFCPYDHLKEAGADVIVHCRTKKPTSMRSSGMRFAFSRICLDLVKEKFFLIFIVLFV